MIKMNINKANIWGTWVEYNPHILGTNEIIKVLIKCTG